MNTHTSKQKIWLRSVLLLPIIALALYGFSDVKVIERDNSNADVNSILQSIDNSYKGNESILIFQEQATAEEVAEYNKLARHYNSLSKDRQIIRSKDIERLNTIYGKMSQEQKVNSKPFPNIPPPPPAPPVPQSKNNEDVKTGFLKANGETLYFVELGNKKTFYNKSGNSVDRNGVKLNGNAQVNASDVIPGHYITKVYQNDRVIAEFKNNHPELSSENLIAPPPPPKSPLDHVIDMAKKDATFFYENKSISSDEAIQLLKKQKKLNIETKEMTSKNPKVYISEKPINPKKQTVYNEQIKTSNSSKGSRADNEPLIMLPAPLPAPNPNKVEYIQQLGESGATFFIGPHKYSIDKVIEMVKKNNDTEIDVSQFPIVLISGC